VGRRRRPFAGGPRRELRTVSPQPLLGLRVDVDTHDGMRLGVPVLLDLFGRAGVRATFYLTMGPDRSGLAVFNLLRPGFLRKMRSSGATRIYGWRTILSGTLLPARPIALAFPEIARWARDEGHETGVHAWDHRRWQDAVLRWPETKVRRQLDLGREAYRKILGADPTTYAAPAWLTCDSALLHQESFDLRYASDCRGNEPFLPVAAGRRLRTPQVPATLPTLDEALGQSDPDAPSFFRRIVDAARDGRFEVFTLHAEIEGGPYAIPFARLLADLAVAGVECLPLGELLARRLAEERPLPERVMGHAPVAGRHGVVSTPVPAPHLG